MAQDNCAQGAPQGRRAHAPTGFRRMSGTKHTFGSSDSTRIASTSPTKIYRWMLEEIQNTNNNNYIKYTYNKDSGQIYPSQIIYTGNGVTDGDITIDFYDLHPSRYVHQLQTGLLGHYQQVHY